MRFTVASFLLATTLQWLLPTVQCGNNNGNATAYNQNAYSSSGIAYGINYMVDSQETAYDGYAQAWRYLGWYVECGNPSDIYNQQSHHSNDNGNYYYSSNNWCQRFLMWAMYIDPNYTGGGIGEYAFYDSQKGYWDQSACNYHGNGRCAYMDCHDTSTSTWELLGVYKEAEYFGNDAFFEQLFKHEGVCLWNDEDIYEFMSETREDGFVAGCIQTSVYDDNGSNLLYIDLKPTFNGNMTYGLYTDEICATEYDGVGVSVDEVAANMGMLYGQYLQMWNDGLEVYKVCQPCMAYNLQSVPSSGYNSSSNSWGYNRYKKYGGYASYNYKNYYKDDDAQYGENYYDYDNDPNEGYFQCADDANYYNVNQCMKFRTHANLQAATFEDLVRATNQGGILEINVAGTIFGSPRITREEESYWDYVRKEQVQKELAAEQAEKVAQESAVTAALQDKSHAFLFMGAGMITLGSTLLWLLFGANGSKRSPLAEPFFDNEGEIRGVRYMREMRPPDFHLSNMKTPDFSEAGTSMRNFMKTPDFSEAGTSMRNFIKNVKVPEFPQMKLPSARATNSEVV